MTGSVNRHPSHGGPGFWIRIVAMLAALAGLTIAATAARAETSPDEALRNINAYFNDIETMRGEFVQVGPNGQRTDGQFALKRPGKVRFFYNPPSQLDIIADGTSVAVRNRKRASQDIWPLKRTPLRFLLSDDIDLTTDAKVSRLEMRPDVVEITIEEDTAFGDGTLKLIFDRGTSELKKWEVTDAQGQTTEVSIYNVALDRPVDPDLFKIDYTIIREGVNNRR
ncbi:LolA family protein [Amorphus orientalis]|uniref:Outer membrane lipoprotein-sorting protein n=1 Tax=Amorphus orientalis TaxID=649198 RepID=A0AAE4AVU1_9HYPH|nr:outer-membrane lipoprotein carrier protein LolA [Amorphus orientalis]MDQ0317039.1 outer membrane lipoprotein-sorting protein [Amorphus orientalis]